MLVSRKPLRCAVVRQTILIIGGLHKTRRAVQSFIRMSPSVFYPGVTVSAHDKASAVLLFGALSVLGEGPKGCGPEWWRRSA
jgi:hypothetical protein